MTNEEKRIAIVGAFPEVFVRPAGAHGWNYKNSTVGRILPCIDGDPLKDLNAMHEAWLTLSRRQQQAFAQHISSKPKFHRLCKKNVITCRYLLFGAEAADMAESFGIIKGLWTD